ncbi:MAG TPA: DUF5996 family protein [Segetibacter sp.]|jgi:hypothetical protein
MFVNHYANGGIVKKWQERGQSTSSVAVRKEWETTKMTLHLFMQIVGKIKLKSMPRKNHWWNLTLFINSKGVTTGSMPYTNGCFEVQFNFINHHLEINTNKGGSEAFNLQGISVAEFYTTIFKKLDALGIHVKILAKPYSLPDANPITTPFEEMTEYNAYDKEYVERFWSVLLWVHETFTEFSGRFYGKTSPVQLFWHHLDLAVTRFSSKKVPFSKDMKVSDKDAYSHEVVSFGFWAGDENVKEPAFYSYTYPSPKDLDKQPLEPSFAKWENNNGSAMALLLYNDLKKEVDPRNILLDFLESCYIAGASLAGWQPDELKVPDIKDL